MVHKKKIKCPECGKKNAILRMVTGHNLRYHCKSCGMTFRKYLRFDKVA